MPAPSFRVKMNITTSSDVAYLRNYRMQQQKMVAAAPRQALRQMTLNSPMVGRIHNVRPGCGSCGK